MSKVSYYTEEGINRLKYKLNHLKSIERPKASKAIAEARDKGDLSENAEYDAAKEFQRILEGQIVELEQTLANARILDESKIDSSKALIHSIIEVQNARTNTNTTYKLVAQSEADLMKGKISVESPIGKGLLGREVGDTVEIPVPNGTVELKILKISR